MQAKFKKITVRKRKLRVFVLKGILFLLLFIAVGTALLFVDFTYKTFSMSQRNVKVDAIVVLAGGRGRIEEGVSLYRARQGKYLYLIGVDPSVRKPTLFRAREGEPGGEGVFLEKASRNTLENALYSRDLMQNNGIHSILLITSRYHMKRATLIFRNIFPEGMEIYSHPVDSKNLKEEWWSHAGSFRLLFSEFYKYCFFRILFLFDLGELKAQK